MHKITVIGYIITSQNINVEHGATLYYATDIKRNKCPYWALTPTAAEVFKTVDSALLIFNGKELDENNVRKMDDGMLIPTKMIQDATGISTTRLRNKSQISIIPLLLGNVVISKEVIGEIKKFKNFIC